MVLLGVFHAAGCTAPESCIRGSEGCLCEIGGGCEAGLRCEQDRCIAEGGADAGADSGMATDAGPSDPGPSDPGGTQDAGEASQDAASMQAADAGETQDDGSMPVDLDAGGEPDASTTPALEPPTTHCHDTCPYADDGECDDGLPGSSTAVCAPGSDCTDCGPVAASQHVCTDTCEFAGDGVCDDGGPDSAFAECAYGTDCGDCGERAVRECQAWGETCETNGECCGRPGGWCVRFAGDATAVCAASCSEHTDCVSGCCVPLDDGSGDGACGAASHCNNP